MHSAFLLLADDTVIVPVRHVGIGWIIAVHWRDEIWATAPLLPDRAQESASNGTIFMNGQACGTTAVRRSS